MSDIAAEIIRKQENLAKDRSTFENHWSEVAPYVLPRQDEFFNRLREQGEKRSWRRYDDTAILALDRFAAAMESILTPRSSKWHKLSVTDEDLQEDQEVQEWLDDVTDLLFRVRYSTKANFASQMHETYMSLGAFGTGVMIVEDVVGKGIRYKSSHIGEHYFMEDLHGVVNRNYRRYRLTALQAAEKFGTEELPSVISIALDKEPHKKFEFIHCVIPNEEGGMAYKSFHVAVDGKKLLAEGGFKTFPYIISRYVTSPNETYGRSPAMSSLAEIKMLNQMRKTDIKARHMAVDPPVLAADQSRIRKFNNKPGAINWGTLDEGGNPLARPYQSGARVDVSNDGINQSREFINDTFLVTLFQILVETPAMTATEVLQRAQEKGSLLSPTAGRQQSEMLGPLIEREISLLEEYGIFEDEDQGGMLPMPDALKERDGRFEIEYTSPLSRMQKSEEALATERTIQALIPFAEQGSLDRVDFNEYGDIIREANGAPAKIFKSDEEMEAQAAAQAEAAAMQQMVGAMPEVAGAIKDVSQAQKFASEAV